MPVIVRFIKTEGFVSDVISALTGSLFDHVEFGTPEGTWIGARDQGGVQERAADYCSPVREYVYEIPSTDEEQIDLLAWARAKIGTPYNFEDIAGLALQVRALNNPKEDICSEFCCVGLLKTFGAERVLNVLENWAYRVTPETLHLSPLFVGNLLRRSG